MPQGHRRNGPAENLMTNYLGEMSMEATSKTHEQGNSVESLRALIMAEFVKNICRIVRL